MVFGRNDLNLKDILFLKGGKFYFEFLVFGKIKVLCVDLFRFRSLYVVED